MNSSEDTKGLLEELRGVNKELHDLNKRLRDLRVRKRELEEGVMIYLEENKKSALKYNNIVFALVEKTNRGRKGKTEKLKDGEQVLQRHGVDNARQVLEEVVESMKGSVSTTSCLRLKPASIYD